MRPVAESMYSHPWPDGCYRRKRHKRKNQFFILQNLFKKTFQIRNQNFAKQKSPSSESQSPRKYNEPFAISGHFQKIHMQPTPLPCLAPEGLPNSCAGNAGFRLALPRMRMRKVWEWQIIIWRLSRPYINKIKNVFSFTKRRSEGSCVQTCSAVISSPSLAGQKVNPVQAVLLARVRSSLRLPKT